MAEGGGGPEGCGFSDEVLIAAFAMQNDQEDRRSSSSSVGAGYCSGGEGGGGGSGGSAHGASGLSRFSPASSMRRHPSSVPSASTSSRCCFQRVVMVAGFGGAGLAVPCHPPPQPAHPTCPLPSPHLAACVLQVAHGCHPTIACRPLAAPPNFPCWVPPAGSGSSRGRQQGAAASSRRPTLTLSSSTVREQATHRPPACHHSTSSTKCLVAAASSTHS